MFCKNCGSQMDESARFCPKCGANLGAETDHVPAPGKLPGGLHRFCISALIVWTAFWAGLTFSVVGSFGQQAQESTGATIGFGLGLGFYALIWFLPSVVLGIVAIAAKPPQPVVWPRSTKWLTVALVAFFFFVPHLPHLVSTSSETRPHSGASGQGEKNRTTWRLLESKSNMDGSPTVLLSLDADDKVQGWLESGTPTLVIRCKEGQTSAYVIVGMPAQPELGSYGSYGVRLRIDDGSPIQERWTESTDQKGLFSPSPKEFAKLVANAYSLMFEFTPFQSSPATAHFNVSGLNKLLDNVATPCGWSKAQETASAQQKAAKEQERVAQKAALAREQEAQEQERKDREIAHQKQWRLHVDVKPAGSNLVSFRYSQDGRKELRGDLEVSGQSHIDANDQINLAIDWPTLPSQLAVFLNGDPIPSSKWTEIREPSGLVSSHVMHIVPTSQ